MSKLKLAQKVAMYAHKGQFDKAGVAYYHHPETVASKVKTYKQKIVAYLHDVIEDSIITADILSIMGFPKDVVDAVVALTRQDNEKYKDYLERVKSNKLARIVKIADLEHNSDLTRLQKITEQDIKRGVRYAIARNYLLGIITEYNEQNFQN